MLKVSVVSVVKSGAVVIGCASLVCESEISDGDSEVLVVSMVSVVCSTICEEIYAGISIRGSSVSKRGSRVALMPTVILSVVWFRSV